MSFTCKTAFIVAAMFFSTVATAAEVRVAAYGDTKDGRHVTAYTLVNDKGFSATILDFGATISAIRVPDREGKVTNVAMSFADISGWEALGHANAILGRVANRITNGFTIDGVHYPLKPGASGTTMHSATGYTGYSTRIWGVEPISPRDGASVTMTLDSPDGDQGFPGHVKIRAIYHFTNDNALRLDMSATTDKATYINLTNHIYFNLNGNSTVPVYDHELQVFSDQVAGAPSAGVVGQLRSVVGTPFDFFTKPTVLKERMAFTLGPDYQRGPGGSPSAKPLPPTVIGNFDLPFFAHNSLDKVSARLHDPLSGRVLEVRTTEPSVHIFASAGQRGALLSDAGKPFTAVPALAIETQHLPDSPNLPQYPSTELRLGQTFKSTTIFAFMTDNETR